MRIRHALIAVLSASAVAVGALGIAHTAQPQPAQPTAQLEIVTDLLGGLLGGRPDIGPTPLPLPSPTGGQSTSSPG